MSYNMREWLAALPASKRPLPLLSFPSASLVGASVYRFTHDAAAQTEGIVRIAARTNAAAAICMMDLSVEAEAFGCEILSEEDEVPNVIGILITDEDEARALNVPPVGNANRTGLYIEAARNAVQRIGDRPVLAGIIGPFSLAGRLMDVSEALVNCIADEDFVLAALEKTTEFLIAYAQAYKDAGVHGIVMAEPLAGLLSPALEEVFSAPFVRRIIEAVQDDSFIVIYHNCGPNTPFMAESLAGNGAAAYHFGDAVDLTALLNTMPQDKPVCGNISPADQFLNGTPDSMEDAVRALRLACEAYPNFVLSSGCDIPPHAKWENIDAFFRAANDDKQP
ncbi:MAG: uroporphyrinogen decarboxylase family protein [Clostridia bacterium]|nr:uroporphyrinogen decarboxylase family protein [Clostridia bacterium]